jgi:hypothetical protein
MRIQGDYDYEGDEDVIHLDFRKELISSLVHEMIHHIHPSWKERYVKAEEHRIMNSLSVIQVKNIIKKLAKSL